MIDKDAIKSLISAMLEVVVEQKRTAQEISKLVERIDILSSLVANSQKSKVNSVLAKENWPQTVFSLIVLVVMALILIFKGGCSADLPELWITDMDGGMEIDSDSEAFDSDSEAFDSDSEAFDSDSEAFDSDTDSEDIDSDTGGPCPWNCIPIADDSNLTCDTGWTGDTDNPPESVRNWNYTCPDGMWCCQPWPSEIGLTEHCPEQCAKNCNPDFFDDRYDLACFNATIHCCTKKNGGNHEERSDRSKNNQRGIFLDGF